MLISNVIISLFRIRTVNIKSLEKCQFMYYYNRRIDTVAKRASMLEEMITNKDKRKNWHFSIISNKPHANAFKKIHKPHRRRAVLNTLFIRNITDVLSTGDIVPEINNYAIEITGVQVSPCYKILNVFWQVPVSQYGSSEDIGKLLNIAAPKIRAELISRNVLGRVPFVFFIRDCTNARVAAFEEAMQKLEAQPKSDSSIIADDSFVEDIYIFKDSRVDPDLKSPETVKEEAKKEDITIPKKPIDMRCDVFGLDHNEMMEKVVALKRRKNPLPQKSAVISPENLSNEDIFSKIPGVCFKADSSAHKMNREAIFRKFLIERKVLMEKHKNIDFSDNPDNYEYQEDEEDDDTETIQFYDDFIEDETADE